MPERDGWKFTTSCGDLPAEAGTQEGERYEYRAAAGVGEPDAEVQETHWCSQCVALTAERDTAVALLREAQSYSGSNKLYDKIEGFLASLDGPDEPAKGAAMPNTMVGCGVCDQAWPAGTMPPCGLADCPWDGVGYPAPVPDAVTNEGVTWEPGDKTRCARCDGKWEAGQTTNSFDGWTHTECPVPSVPADEVLETTENWSCRHCGSQYSAIARTKTSCTTFFGDEHCEPSPVPSVPVGEVLSSPTCPQCGWSRIGWSDRPFAATCPQCGYRTENAGRTCSACGLAITVPVQQEPERSHTEKLMLSTQRDCGWHERMMLTDAAYRAGYEYRKAESAAVPSVGLRDRIAAAMFAWDRQKMGALPEFFTDPEWCSTGEQEDWLAQADAALSVLEAGTQEDEA